MILALGTRLGFNSTFYSTDNINADAAIIQVEPFDKVAELYGAAGFRAETLAEVAEAVQAALDCGKPAVVDVAVDPDALYSFRRDSFAHRNPDATEGTS